MVCGLPLRHPKALCAEGVAQFQGVLRGTSTFVPFPHRRRPAVSLATWGRCPGERVGDERPAVAVLAWGRSGCSSRSGRRQGGAPVLEPQCVTQRLASPTSGSVRRESELRGTRGAEGSPDHLARDGESAGPGGESGRGQLGRHRGSSGPQASSAPAPPKPPATPTPPWPRPKFQPNPRPP